VGKKCRYRWGDPYVKPVGPMTRRENLIGLLFPFVVCSFAFIILTVLFILWTQTYFFSRALQPAWGGTIFLGALVFLVYYNAVVSILDLQKAYRLLFNKPSTYETPFDVLIPRSRALTKQRQIFAWTIMVVCAILLAL
jgi:hypothetical protein